jgi:hypothetical protein
VFDLLINAEVIVDDVGVAERVFVDALGFPEPRPSWSGTVGAGFSFLFARVHPSMAVAPTRIEAMAVGPTDPGVEPFLPQLLAAQGRRPWKTHGNELATSDIDGVAARLARNGRRFYTMREEGYEYTRLWLGWTADDLGAYRPEVDGGLLFEICETGALMQGPEFWVDQPEPDLAPGSMVRVVRRSWIVEDLAATLAAIERNLDWRPRLGPETDDATGCRRAVFGFTHPRSAELELLEPVAPGEVRDSLETWGPGGWTIRIGVNDLAAKADDLGRRGMTFDSRASDRDRAVLRVDTGPLDVPGLFEFSQV